MFAYSSGNFGKAMVFSGAELTILYLLTDVLGVSGSTAAYMLLLAGLGDMVFDLLAARLVLYCRSGGRGYRWTVAVAALPCGTAFALIYALPAIGLHRIWLLAGAMLIFRSAYAVVDVPHNALMAQVSRDSRERGRISGYRLFFSTVSTSVVGFILTPMVQRAARTRQFDSLAGAGFAVGFTFALTMVLCVWASGRTSIRALRGDGIKVPLRDPIVKGMAVLAVLTGFALPCFSRMLIYLGNYVLDRPNAVIHLLIALTAGQFCGVLAWTALGHRFSKSRLLGAGHAVTALGLLFFGFCMEWPVASVACAGLVGFGFASVFMLPWGLLADAVDVVEWRHGMRFETGLFALYLVLVKASGSAAAALIGGVLSVLGYVPGTGQSAMVRLGIVALALGIPLTGALLSVLLLRRFTLDHARHARLLSALTWRQKATERVL